jgi:hydrogenase/urease accessory protein HupE
VELLRLQEHSLFGTLFRNKYTLIAILALLFLASNANAHLVTTGAGSFYDGTAHFFLSFEEILPVVALSLFGGLRGPQFGRWLIVVLPVCWIIGGFAAFKFHNINLPSAIITVLVMLFPGALLASDWNLPIKIVIAIAALFGLLLGFLNGIAMPQGSFLELIGSSTAAFIVAVLSAALAVALNHGWTRIVIRVAGSWLTALGLLALGWSLKAK